MRATDAEGIERLGVLNAEFHRIVVAASGSSQLMVLTGSVGRVSMMDSLFRRAAAFRAGSNHQHRTSSRRSGRETRSGLRW